MILIQMSERSRDLSTDNEGENYYDTERWQKWNNSKQLLKIRMQLLIIRSLWTTVCDRRMCKVCES